MLMDYKPTDKGDVEHNAEGFMVSRCGRTLLKVKVKVTLEQVTKVQRVSRGIALFFL
jgi:hypothetical protein